MADNKSEFDNRYYDFDAMDGAAIVNGRRTNAFEVDEKNVALYGSYQWKVNERWGALVGLRTEYTDLDLDQAKDTLANIQFIWGRPVHVQTIVDGKPAMLAYDGSEHAIRIVGEGEDAGKNGPAKR